jgi:hypothetical protein
MRADTCSCAEYDIGHSAEGRLRELPTVENPQARIFLGPRARTHLGRTLDGEELTGLLVALVAESVTPMTMSSVRRRRRAPLRPLRRCPGLTGC